MPTRSRLTLALPPIWSSVVTMCSGLMTSMATYCRHSHLCQPPHDSASCVLESVGSRSRACSFVTFAVYHVHCCAWVCGRAAERERLLLLWGDLLLRTTAASVS